MSSKKTDLLQGTLDLLVLKMLAHGPLHGYGIAQKILLTSKQVLDVQQRALYPALHRLERKSFVTAEWHESENGRMAKFYSLTKMGASTSPMSWPIGRVTQAPLIGFWRHEQDALAMDEHGDRPRPRSAASSGNAGGRISEARHVARRSHAVGAYRLWWGRASERRMPRRERLELGDKRTPGPSFWMADDAQNSCHHLRGRCK